MRKIYLLICTYDSDICRAILSFSEKNDDSRNILKKYFQSLSEVKDYKTDEDINKMVSNLLKCDSLYLYNDFYQIKEIPFNIEVINKDENNLVAIEDMFDDMNITLHNSSCLLYGKPVSDKTIENIVSAMKGAILLSIQEEKERELQNKSKDK